MYPYFKSLLKQNNLQSCFLQACACGPHLVPDKQPTTETIQNRNTTLSYKLYSSAQTNSRRGPTNEFAYVLDEAVCGPKPAHITLDSCLTTPVPSVQCK